VTDDKLEISLADAKALKPEAELGDELELEQERPPQEFGRIAAQTAKTGDPAEGRDAEREGSTPSSRARRARSSAASCTGSEEAQRVSRSAKAEAILPEREQIPGERYNPAIASAPTSSRCAARPRARRSRLSRTHPGYLAASLSRREIPEIQEASSW